MDRLVTFENLLIIAQASDPIPDDGRGAPNLLEVAFWSVNLIGLALALGYPLWRWHHPGRSVLDLPRPRRLSQELAIGYVFGALLAYVLNLVLVQLAPVSLGPGEQIVAGTHIWHELEVWRAWGGLLTAGLLAFMVAVMREGDRQPKISAGTWARSLGFSVPVAIAVTQLLHLAGNAVWSRITDTDPVVHASLRALDASDWGVWGVVQICISAGIVAPIVEEYLYRGVFFEALWRASGNVGLALVTTSILFGIQHLTVPTTVIPLIAFGLILGYVRLKTGSLLAAILVHAAFNFWNLAIRLLHEMPA